jgi:hypothetical protein
LCLVFFSCGADGKSPLLWSDFAWAITREKFTVGTLKSSRPITRRCGRPSSMALWLIRDDGRNLGVV